MPELDPTQIGALAHERRLLLKLGYRMLGSTADAEDAVQETYVRWYRLSEEERRAIAQPVAWLVKAATRVCLDMLGSARARRERYVGPWLPEPLPAAAPWAVPEDSEGPAAVDESVSMALLVVLEAMTPAERVAFVLHDVFGYSFADVAEMIGRSPQACRQLASSARRRVGAARADARRDANHGAVVSAFKAAWDTGDVAALIALLDPSAVVTTDGGGLVSAALDPIAGAEAVARFLLGARDRQPGLALEAALVNGQPGLVARAAGTTVAVIAVDVVGDGVRNLWVMRNPEKLRGWN